MGAPSIDWRKTPTPLCGQPDPVVHAILHYLYAECLPKGLSEEAARQVYEATQKVPEFSKLTALCETFLKNTALRQRKASSIYQGTHCTGNTGKMAKKNPCQRNHREFGNFAKTQGKHREFCKFPDSKGISKCAVKISNFCFQSLVCQVNFVYVIVTNHVNWHRENVLLDRENTRNLKMQFEWVP